MRLLILTILCFIAVISTSNAQQPLVDKYPRAQIYVIDLQSGQETPAASDAAILFKNSLIDLVRTTNRARQVSADEDREMNNRVFTITQMGAETNVNGYQIVLEELGQSQNQNRNIYTFVFHADDNTLYFYDPATQNWQLERIMPNNVFNLRRVATYGRKFYEEFASQGGNNTINASVDLNAPVDADVVADNAPPVMPEYEQPECPNDDYLWQPGYWAFSPWRHDYYWVPGAWVAPPTPGVLWTPPYWGYEGSRYIFHVGYWGDHIGFYGGINYGYGYSGHGYYGGEWRGGHFRYNTAVVRVNTTIIHNTYINRTVINNTVINNRNSFNGHGGVMEKPSSEEIAVTHEHHLKPTPEQNGHQLQARENPNQFTKANNGGKPVFASPTVLAYHPKNNNGKGGLTGNPNQPQGTNPAKPTIEGTNPGKPNGRGANPGIQGTNPGKPNTQGTNPDKPNVKGNNPDKPGIQGTTPDKPNVQGANPDKPNVQGNNPVKPGIQGTNPNKPNVQGSNPDKPKVQGTNPGKPQGLITNPGKPAVQQTKPVKPADTKPKEKDKPKTDTPKPAKS